MSLRQVTRAASALAVGVGIVGSGAPAMAQDNFLGEIRMVGFTYCPRGWADANGQLLPIAQNTALFALFGTIYGGDGRTTFALPDLRSRQAIHTGRGPGLSDFPQGASGGTETNTLTTANLAPHNHAATSQLLATAQAADATDPTNAALATPSRAAYAGATPSAQMQPGSVTTTIATAGAGQPVNNRDPYLTVRFCVALAGIFPSRN